MKSGDRNEIGIARSPITLSSTAEPHYAPRTLFSRITLHSVHTRLQHTRDQMILVDVSLHRSSAWHPYGRLAALFALRQVIFAKPPCPRSLRRPRLQPDAHRLRLKRGAVRHSSLPISNLAPYKSGESGYSCPLHFSLHCFTAGHLTMHSFSYVDPSGCPPVSVSRPWV